jgi:Na+-transporting methylmalonyl-CoA/oxaloacetate decarboxylase gamma subunit
MLLGMGVVFFGLICLITIIKLLTWVYGAVSKTSKETAQPALAAASAAVAGGYAVPVENRRQFMAAVAAAIATDMRVDIDGLRIHAIVPRSVPGQSHGQLVAAVAAAVTTDMGVDVDGLRIHSIRPQ